MDSTTGIREGSCDCDCGCDCACQKRREVVTVDPEERKNYARNQLAFLKENGIAEPRRLSRIFKAAGPGQIQSAWELIKQADTPARVDLLDCLLTGVGGSQNFGKERMVAAIEAAGFKVPETSSSNTFFRMIDGALEILIPGGYQFTDEELLQIEEGLERGRERAKSFGVKDEPE